MRKCKSSFSGCDVSLTGTGAASGGTAVFQYNNIPTTGHVMYIVAKGTDTPKVRVDYVSGSPNVEAQVNTGITFTGDEATGCISFNFASVASSDGGIYTLTNSLGNELQCITLHILGKLTNGNLSGFFEQMFSC